MCCPVKMEIAGEQPPSTAHEHLCKHATFSMSAGGEGGAGEQGMIFVMG
jgi:hypothetical protein